MDTPKEPKKKRWFTTWWGLLIIVVISLFLIGIGYFVFALVQEIGSVTSGELSPYAEETSSSGETSSNGGSLVADISVDGRPSQGNFDASVVIVEFGDFQCPFCKKEFPIVRKIMVDYKDEILFVYRHYPLSAVHPDAQKAAEASECAFDQEKFWEYHDLLFLNQERLDIQSLKNYAIQAGIDTERFNNCLDSGEMASVVAKDVADGRAAGVTGTPTFFINGNRVSGALPDDFFRQAIDHFK